MKNLSSAISFLFSILFSLHLFYSLGFCASNYDSNGSNSGGSLNFVLFGIIIILGSLIYSKRGDMFGDHKLIIQENISLRNQVQSLTESLSRSSSPSSSSSSIDIQQENSRLKDGLNSHRRMLEDARHSLQEKEAHVHLLLSSSTSSNSSTSPSTSSSSSLTQQEHEALKAEIAAIKRDQESWKSTKEVFEGKIKTLEADLKERSAFADRVRSDIEQLHMKISNITATEKASRLEVESLRSQTLKLEEELANSNELLRKATVHRDSLSLSNQQSDELPLQIKQLQEQLQHLEKDEVALSNDKKPQIPLLGLVDSGERLVEGDLIDSYRTPRSSTSESANPSSVDQSSIPNKVLEVNEDDHDQSRDRELLGDLPQEDEIDITKFKKLLPKKGGKVKGWNESLERGFQLKADDTSTLVSLLDNKTPPTNQIISPSSSKRTMPSFMDVFRPPEASSSSSSESVPPIASPMMSPSHSSEGLMELKPWKSGEPLVKEFAVKEDINKKGMRRTKKKATMWGNGTTKGPEMEDQNLLECPFGSESRGIFCVFDGHAGANCAIAAKEAFPRLFQKKLSAKGSLGTDQTDVFKAVYFELDQELLPFEYEGCTCTTVFVWEYEGNRYAQGANVGDSTAFLFRSNQALPLSFDHKATSMEEKDRIINSGIELNRNATRVGGLAVSRALGDHFLKTEKTGIISEPFVSQSFKLEPADWAIVVASDGLWDVMDGDRAKEICREADDSNAMARRLLQQGLADPKCTDNTTVIVVTL